MNKRKLRGGPTGSPRARSVVAEGVYNNALFMHAVTCHVGNVVQIKTYSGAVWEGVFRTFSSQFEVVLEVATRVDTNNINNQTSLNIDSVVDKMIFRPSDIVCITARDVDLDYATKDTFQTDTAISKYNGQNLRNAEERQLEPWDPCSGGINGDDAANSSLELEPDANGWDANEMFKKNEQVYGVTSTFDHSLAGYTLPLQRKDTADYKELEGRAAEIAHEIESQPSYKAHLELENGDEEERFAAVQRNTPSNSSGNNNSGKYVPPAKRSNPSSGKLIQQNSNSPQQAVLNPSIFNKGGGGGGSGGGYAPKPSPPSAVVMQQNSQPPPQTQQSQQQIVYQQSPPTAMYPPLVPPPGSAGGGIVIQGGGAPQQVPLPPPQQQMVQQTMVQTVVVPSTPVVVSTRPHQQPSPPKQHMNGGDTRGNDHHHHPPPTGMMKPTVQQQQQRVQLQRPPPPSSTDNSSAPHQNMDLQQPREQRIPRHRGVVDPQLQTMQDLRKFSQDFKLVSSDQPSQQHIPSQQQISPPTQLEQQLPPPGPPKPQQTPPSSETTVSTQPSQHETTTVVIDKVATAFKKSTLNPNAKEFNPKSFTPRSPSTPSASRPHTPQTPSPYVVSQQPATVSMAQTHSGGGGQGQGQPMPMVMPAYVMTNQPPYQTAPHSQSSRFRKVQLSGIRTDMAQQMQVAAATGQPLLAPAPLQQFVYPPGGLAPQPYQQVHAVRMYHHESPMQYLGPPPPSNTPSPGQAPPPGAYPGSQQPQPQPQPPPQQYQTAQPPPPPQGHPHHPAQFPIMCPISLAAPPPHMMQGGMQYHLHQQAPPPHTPHHIQVILPPQAAPPQQHAAGPQQ
ncbi:ataxin-2-like protein isoform X2 [Chrysoperla carnea]|uniref:ataxin-2-like protein isoform X2 n=1 Tax=Chrysoperla carnea TaxID=189513 RepID=UPI001D07FA3B|nr:ataxin-2-like protein isoform X2 [Chrysoperla carnea]